MPALDFTSIDAAVTIIEQRTGLTRTDEWDTLLEQTAGTNPGGTTMYRAWGVAALLLGQAQHEAVVREAEGVKFNDPRATLRALVATQASWDSGLSLTVPSAWTIAKIEEIVLSTDATPVDFQFL